MTSFGSRKIGSYKPGMTECDPSLGTMVEFLITAWCSRAIRHVNNSQEPRDVATMLQYEPVYRHHPPPCGAAQSGCPPPLCIREPTQQVQRSNSNDLSQQLDEATVELARVQAQAAETSIGSSNDSNSLELSSSELATVVAAPKVKNYEKNWQSGEFWPQLSQSWWVGASSTGTSPSTLVIAPELWAPDLAI
ncbi:hypothetical protein Acr_23g0010770 [Actinidia rufa]|uniref:Uncharacterized protein n=1 Tax=Actinidia rufa TaxID=165716 RepID=A0A7J0GPH5_9ERIC|nr:hypothetical protein Acr_23g0010770 [Actinidia rufa]